MYFRKAIPRKEWFFCMSAGGLLGTVTILLAIHARKKRRLTLDQLISQHRRHE